MINRAYRLSSNWKHFINECEALKLTFSNLLYPSQLIETAVNQFITNVATDKVQSDADRNNDTTPTVMFSTIYISQSAADCTRRQLQDLSSKIGVSLQPIFKSKKIGEIIKTREPRPKFINEQCVVYHFTECGLCEMDYVSFTNRHLFQRINEHTNSRSSIGKQMKLQHGVQQPAIAEKFTVLKKCQSKLDCLVYKMLLIKELKPSLNVQSDSIRAKLFTDA